MNNVMAVVLKAALVIRQVELFVVNGEYCSAPSGSLRTRRTATCIPALSRTGTGTDPEIQARHDMYSSVTSHSNPY